METSLRLLLIGDDKDSATLAPLELRHAGYDIGVVERVATVAHLQRFLERQPWDLVVCAFNPSHLDAAAAITLVRAYDTQLPFVIVADQITVEEAMMLIRRGANELVLRHQLGELGEITSRLLHARTGQQPTTATKHAEPSTPSRATNFKSEGSPITDRRSRVLESSDLWRATFQQTVVGLAHVDLNSHWLLVNDTLCSMLGYTREELLSSSTRKITHPDDLAVHGDLTEHLLAGKIPTYSIQKRYLQKDGGIVWANVTISLVRDSDGAPLHFVSVFVDITQRKHAELALQASEERLTLALLGSNDGVWDWDLMTNQVYRSPRWLQMLGLPEDLTGECDLETLIGFIHPDDRLRVAQDFIAHLEGRTPYFEYEERLLHTDGEYRWILVRGLCQRDASGKPYRMSGVNTEITERKRSEEELREAQAWLELAVTAARIGLWDWDLKTDEARYASSWRRLFGYSTSEFHGMREEWANLLHPTDHERLLRGVAVALATVGPPADESPYEEEYQLRHRDGTYRWVLSRISILRDSAGLARRMIGAHVDITARKQAEQRMREVQVWLDVAVSAAGVGLWNWDLHSDQVHYSDNFLQRFGYADNDEEFSRLQRRWINLVHPDDRDQLRQSAQAAIADAGTPFEVEFRMRHKDGTHHWVLSRATVVFDSAGNPQRMLGANVDISRRKLAEDTARRSARRTQAVFAASGDVISIQTAEGVIRETSPSIRDLLGFDVAEIIGRNGFEFVHPDDVAVAIEAFKQRLALPIEHPPAEFRLVRRDGSSVYVEATLQNLLDDPDVGGIVTTMRNITERKNAAAANLLEVREEESARLAREIHDQLGQGLTALRMDAAWITGQLALVEQDPRVAAILARLRSMDTQIQHNVTAVRRIATELRPVILDDLGLLATIEWQVEEFQNRSGIRCEFRAWPALPVPDASRSTVILRVLQEALTNVVRHAVATRVVIHLRAANGFLCLEVRDNGRGICQAEMDAACSLGIKGMKERAAYVGGEIVIGGAAGRGTTITLRVPQA